MTETFIAHVNDLRAGKLEQACPACGVWEAAGSHCTACLRRMGPADWYRNGDLDRREVARQIVPRKQQTPVKQPSPVASGVSVQMALTESQGGVPGTGVTAPTSSVAFPRAALDAGPSPTASAAPSENGGSALRPTSGHEPA